MKPQNNLLAMRHSCEHVLTQAMLCLFPGIKMAMGPAIENGFYFDFDPGKHKISEADFSKIEEEMKKIIKTNLPIRCQEISLTEARKLFKDNPYKQEWLDEIEAKGEKVTVYWTGNEFVDLCAGPHVKSTGEIGPFKLLSVAGAYWRGDEKNKMLTRIYGTCFPTQKELDQYLWQQEEAKKRDHRKLGKELDLFTTSEEIGPGLILWHPHLSVIRNEIENFWKKEHQKRGYQYVYSPHLGKKSLWEKSGHWQFYRELMYSPMNIEGTEYLVKPMNCPFHLQIYQSKPRSYKELPIRYCELGTVYRYEPIGTLHGLTRVRGFTQDDAHIFCTSEQLEGEVLEVLNLAIFMLQSFGFKKFQVDISVRDPQNKEKYLGSDQIWKKAELALETALKRKKLKYYRAEGEAVFYGPKIDIKLVDAAERTWQGPTIQVDFNFPAKFNLEYTGNDGKIHQPVMIHRTVLGSMERFVGTLIEHYAGAFPVWLSPIQVIVIPIAEKHNQYAQKIVEILKENNIRAELDDRNETISAKIRDAELQKIPYILVVGDREVNRKTVNVRTRGEKVLGEISLEAFLKKVTSDIAKKE